MISAFLEESPYGDQGVEYIGTLGMFQHFKLQLISFRSPNKTKEESEYLERDIEGYELIINSKSEANAINFLKKKQEGKFRDNLEVISAMKKEGLWIDEEEEGSEE